MINFQLKLLSQWSSESIHDNQLKHFRHNDTIIGLKLLTRTRKDGKTEIDITPIGKRGSKDEYILDKKKEGTIEVRKCK